MSKLITLALCLIAFSYAHAGTDHSAFISGEFKTGEDVTKACIMCHDKQAEDFMKTSHWKWKGTPKMIKGKENSKEEYGKLNLFNNFCTFAAVEESIGFCARCHAGYGMTNLNFDFKDKTKIDCLICHDRTGTYKRMLGAQPDKKLIENKRMDLTKVAQSVGKSTRDNCGYCHFFGGGGDAVKHGDLDSTLSKPKREQDVHMGGMDFNCQACHVTKDHKIGGASTFLATYESRISCEDCHSGAREPHKDSVVRGLISKHTKSLACQTCHIPAFARGQATKMSWDWSTVGKDIKDAPEQFDKETYAKHKGSFTWAKNVIPTYAWYNGKTERYLLGDKIDLNKTVYISKPVGSIKDANSKIYPFKVHTGKQPADSEYKYLLPFQTFKGLWSHYDWQKAIEVGAKSTGLKYSGKYQFVKTDFYGSINHEVAPKENTLKCRDCHFDSKRFNWKELGYKDDPMKTGGRFAQNLVSTKADSKESKHKQK